MKCYIIAIGKSGEQDWANLAYVDYAKRLKSYCDLHKIEVTAIKRTKNISIEKIKFLESELLMHSIPKGSITIALDRNGKEWNTMQFAKQIEDWKNQSYTISFIIGGADGLCPHFLKSTTMQWSLSYLTFPHLLARIIVVEQLYRAFSILNQHPYHR